MEQGLHGISINALALLHVLFVWCFSRTLLSFCRNHAISKRTSKEKEGKSAPTECSFALAVCRLLALPGLVVLGPCKGCHVVGELGHFLGNVDTLSAVVR